MKAPPMWRRYLRFLGSDIDADVDDEIRFHLEARTQDLIASGMAPDAARAEALRRFGDVEGVRKACRDIDWKQQRTRRRTEYLTELRQDLRYAARMLRKNPGFTVVAVLTLTLGIGATTAIFSMVNSVLLRPLPYAEPERLVAFVDAGAYRGELLEYQDRTRSFTEIAGYYGGNEFSLTDHGEPVRLEGATVTAGLFSVLGAEAALGRTFRPGEDRTGRDQVAVLSYGLWRQRFGANPEIIGEQIQIDGVSRTVVGVMPPDFRFPSGSTRLWVPAPIDPEDPVNLWAFGLGNIIGRLRPGVTVERAAAEIGTLAPRMRDLFPWNMPADWGVGATVVPLREHMIGDVRPSLLILLGAVGFVLLIACANVANLFLARTTARQTEIAIRAALGAGRWRIVRQVLTESLLLALIGGVAGLVLAYWGVEFLTTRLPADSPRLEEIGVDGRVMGFALVLTLLTGLLFGILPALRASGSSAPAVLKEGGRSGTSAGRRRLSGALVAAEISLAVVLVTGAGLLIQSYWQIVRIDPGFRVENVVTATVAPPGFHYEDDASRRVFYQELVRRLESLPGVRGVAVTSGLPFGSNHGTVFKIEGRPDPANEGGDWPISAYSGVISENYLQTMGIPLLRGRGFTAADRADAPGVILISESLAREYWPGEDPIGERLINAAGQPWGTVVGIVADVKVDSLNARLSPTALYRPLLQGSTGAMSVVVRTTADPDALATNLREVVASVDPDTPVDDIRTMEQLVSASVAEPRFTMLLLVAFAAVALVLGAVGIYGVLAYTVSRRTQEIGVRMALGAKTGDVLRMVVRQGVVLAGIGIVVGLAAAFVVTRVLAGLLYGVSATNPLTFTGVAALLAAVALLASYLPARRATRVDPITALKAE